MSFILLGILNAQAEAAAADAYDLLETEILTSNQTSVTFTGLGAYTDYKHLQIRAVARSSHPNNFGNFGIRFNGDTGSNYFSHRFGGNGSTVYSQSLGTRSYIYASETPGDDNDASVFSGQVIDILDAFQTTKFTTTRTFAGYTDSANRVATLMSGLWNNTSAISSLTIFEERGANWVTGSRFSLYGIRAA